MCTYVYVCACVQTHTHTQTHIYIYIYIFKMTTGNIKFDEYCVLAFLNLILSSADKLESGDQGLKAFS